MILLIDQGNTRIKWLLVRNNGTVVGGGAEDNHAPISLLIDKIGSEHISSLREIHGCNVAGAERADLLSEELFSAVGLVPNFIRHPEDCPELVLSGYKDPVTLGVDRWLCMIGARQGMVGPLLVASAGTAVTIDGIDGDGRHLGGYILPGLRAQFRALTNAARLQAVEVRDYPEPVEAWGDTTESAIQFGVLRGVAGAIDRAAAQMDACGGSRVTTVITGGDAATVQPWLQSPVLVVRDLLFRGMWVRVTSFKGCLRE